MSWQGVLLTKRYRAYTSKAKFYRRLESEALDWRLDMRPVAPIFKPVEVRQARDLYEHTGRAAGYTIQIKIR